MAIPQPLEDVLAKLEHGAEGVAEKVAGTVSADIAAITQEEVDQLVSRLEGVAERLVGLGTPATQTATSPAAPAAEPASAAPAAETPVWTPSNPAG